MLWLKSRRPWRARSIKAALMRGNDRHMYAVTGDGKRFLMRVPDQRLPSTPITMVLNWLSAKK